MEEHAAWLERGVEAARIRPTPVIDRFWFRSIYFREPSGVLFEIATLGPGFSVDEDPEHLGEALILPPAFEHLRTQIEPILTPLARLPPWGSHGLSASRLEERSVRVAVRPVRVGVAFAALDERAVDEERRPPRDCEGDRE